MSNQRLPSLNLLRTFECAARHLSFKKAADELFVSQPAVSHQIRTLEEQLGVELFIRLNRKIELTTLGEEYFHQIQGALTALRKATKTLEGKKGKQLFVINSVPMIISVLLVPYIHLFQQEQKDYSIQLDSDISRADFKSGKLDVALRHKVSNEPDLIYIPLMDVSVTPVCSPDYLERHPEVNLDTLENARVIKETIGPNTWRSWLDEWGYNVTASHEMLLNTFQSSMEAVRSGAGIAMGYKPTINPMIRRGELIMPFPDKVTDFDSMYLVYHKRDMSKPVVNHFETWLKTLIQAEWSDK